MAVRLAVVVAVLVLALRIRVDAVGARTRADGFVVTAEGRFG